MFTFPELVRLHIPKFERKTVIRFEPEGSDRLSFKTFLIVLALLGLLAVSIYYSIAAGTDKGRAPAGALRGPYHSGHCPTERQHRFEDVRHGLPGAPLQSCMY